VLQRCNAYLQIPHMTLNHTSASRCLLSLCSMFPAAYMRCALVTVLSLDLTFHMSDTIRIAAIQAEPAWFDASAGVDKSCRLIAEVAATGAQVFGFPVRSCCHCNKKHMLTVRKPLSRDILWPFMAIPLMRLTKPSTAPSPSSWGNPVGKPCRQPWPLPGAREWAL
jgi:aliphatic nitrilase